MAERKLKCGYWAYDLRAEKLGAGNFGYPVFESVRIVVRATDKAWWPENMAPDECFEPKESPMPSTSTRPAANL